MIFARILSFDGEGVNLWVGRWRFEVCQSRMSRSSTISNDLSHLDLVDDLPHRPPVPATLQPTFVELAYLFDRVLIFNDRKLWQAAEFLLRNDIELIRGFAVCA